MYLHQEIDAHVNLKHFIQKYDKGNKKDEFTEEIMIELKKCMKRIERILKNEKDNYDSANKFIENVKIAEKLREMIHRHKVNKK